MTYYRLYFMNGFSGHIERFEEFDADDDEGAVALAEAKQGFLSLELWSGHRKVARIDSMDLAAQMVARRARMKAVKAQVEPAPREDDETNAANRSA